MELFWYNIILGIVGGGLWTILCINCTKYSMAYYFHDLYYLNKHYGDNIVVLDRGYYIDLYTIKNVKTLRKDKDF